MSNSEQLLKDAQKHFDNGVIVDSTHIVNPHQVTSDQIYGLWNVDNTADSAKPVSNAMQVQLDTKVNVADIYNSLEDDGSERDFTKIPLSAAQGKNLSDTIAGLSNINNTVDEYSTRIGVLETELGLTA